MKIRKLHIKNYKVFNDLQLDFTDANGNTLDKIVLAGVNGCGKTTVLEIIKNIHDGSLLGSIGTSDSFIEVEIEVLKYEQKIITEEMNNDIIINSTSLTGKYRNVFRNGMNVSITYSNKVLGAENILNNQHFDSTKLFYLPTKPSETEIAKNQKYQTIHLDTLKSEMKAFALKGIRDEILKNEDIAPRLTKQKEISKITKALNGLNLTTKLVDLESEELIFESANGQKIKFEDLSNGEQNLYFRAIYLSKLNPKDSIIMVDEPEDSLHPTWQQKVVQLYQNIGENNQVIVATHSPHIIGACKAEEVFLLEIDENQVEAKHPIYTKGHSVKHILRAMGTDPNDIEVINKVDAYMALMRKGAHETKEGLQLKAEMDALNLDPNSEEMRRLDLSIKRFKTVGV